ncbi:TolC family protein [Larkinella punicea]|uniref:TolC family protein n=1 Tax=Larkinella punicea TaxID=2315727 RepID=A0A368JPN9_9BACT|nr:TolC family protein [Larkinella punicea]RCR69588.1 TolC family protein [Larkinella punicea]
MKKVFIVILLLASHEGGAQTVVRTVQEALQLARQQNPDLKIARQNRITQEQQRAATRAGLMPTARAFTNLDYNYALPTQLIPAEFLGGQPGEFRSLQFGVPFNLTAGVEVSMPLLSRPNRLDVGLTNQNLRIIDDQNLVLQDEVSTQVARVYHATLLTRSAIDIARRNVANADTVATIARYRLEKGQIEPLEYNRLQSIRLTAEDVLRQNELSYVRNQNQMKILLGLTVRDSLVLEQNLVGSSAQNGFSALNGSVERPQITVRRSQLTLFQQQLNRENALRWPTLSIYARYSAQAQRKQFDFLDFSEKWFPIGVAGLQLNIPLYTGGLRTANLNRARLRIEQAQAELAYEQTRAEADNQDILNAYNQAVRSLVFNRQNFELNEQNTQIALVKYRAGIFAYDQYLNVFNESLNAQNRYLNNLSNVFINQTILQIRNGQ